MEGNGGMLSAIQHATSPREYSMGFSSARVPSRARKNRFTTARRLRSISPNQA
jgi:hypothetical protein